MPVFAIRRTVIRSLDLHLRNALNRGAVAHGCRTGPPPPARRGSRAARLARSLASRRDYFQRCCMPSRESEALGRLACCLTPEQPTDRPQDDFEEWRVGQRTRGGAITVPMRSQRTPTERVLRDV